MNSRIAQIITDAMDEHGKVDRQKVFKSLLVSPEDPTALVVDACLFLHDIPRNLKESSTLLRDDLEKLTKVRLETVAVLEQTRKVAEYTASDNRSVVQSIGTTIRTTVESLDMEQLSNKLSVQLEESTLTPYKRSVEQLLQGTDQLRTATDAAEHAVAAWRKVHLRTIILISAGIWFVIFGGAFLYGWTSLQRYYSNKFVAAIATQRGTLTSNKEAFRELSALGVSIEIGRTRDRKGNEVAGQYCLMMEQPLGVWVHEGEGKKTGVIHFKARFDERVSQAIRDIARTRDLTEELRDEVREIEARRKEKLP